MYVCKLYLSQVIHYRYVSTAVVVIIRVIYMIIWTLAVYNINNVQLYNTNVRPLVIFVLRKRGASMMVQKRDRNPFPSTWQEEETKNLYSNKSSPILQLLSSLTSSSGF
jgi:hypothetical protein